MPELTKSETFYTDLPVLKKYRDITVEGNFRPAPSDWHVIVTDVVNSTGAIESGDYKNVNVIGATTLIGLLNAAGSIEFPFVFGGDGASCLVPPSLLPAARRVLIAARSRAREFFRLELRVGIVPVERVRADGMTIGVAKLRVSEQFSQAIFTGGGLAQAEKLVKHPPSGECYELPPEESPSEADFSGLECRWNPVRSAKGEVLSLLVRACGKTDAEKNAVYQEVIGQIEDVFGGTGGYHPVSQPALDLATKKLSLMAELQAKHGHRLPWIRGLYLAWILFQNKVGSLLLDRPFSFGGVDWKNYKKILVENTDYQKFDDMVRMVISCSTGDREEFECYLKTQRERGRVFYGLHVTDHALLTCLVFDRQQRHFHFVDGSNGGYALAAKALKEQIKNHHG